MAAGKLVAGDFADHLFPAEADGRPCLVVMPDRPVTKQAIAAARFGLEQTLVRTEGLADRGCMNLERVFHDDGARPDAVHQLVFGDKLAGRPNQNFDYFKGTPTNRDGRSGNPKLAACEIDLAVAGCVDRPNAFSMPGVRNIHRSVDLSSLRHLPYGSCSVIKLSQYSRSLQNFSELDPGFAIVRARSSHGRPDCHLTGIGRLTASADVRCLLRKQSEINALLDHPEEARRR